MSSPADFSGGSIMMDPGLRPAGMTALGALMNWNQLSAKSLEGFLLSREEARAVLQAPASETIRLVAAAYEVRKRHFGNRVRFNYLFNIKSGLCPEDCHYCSQSKLSKAPIDKYPLQSVEETLAMAERAVSVHAGRFCMVASGRGPTDQELDRFTENVRAVREKHPQLEICACLGLLSETQAGKL